LPAFFEVLASGNADFVNGSRLVYPMEKGAMRRLNIVANHVFALLFSHLLDQPLNDTLCGTKAMYAADYVRIEREREYFGTSDPFGDFDLLLGASKLGLKIMDLPIRYRRRLYGDTNIQRFRDGLLLLRMTAIAMKRIKLL